LNIKDKIGQKSGMMTLIEIIGRTTTKTHTGIFKCDCGTEVERVIQNVFRAKERKNAISCGCNIKTGQKNSKVKRGFDNDMANQFISGRI